jgi:glycerol-3-phosphate dehydrogenase subunit C
VSPRFHRLAAGVHRLEPNVQRRAAGAAGDSPASARRAAYFYDLFADYYDPSLAATVVSVLEAHSVQVVLPAQKASGIPEMLYGYARRARRIAAANVRGALAQVQDGAALLSAEPTATFAFKVHYSLVANATLDLGEFLLALRSERPESVRLAGPLRNPAGALAGQLDPATPFVIGYHQPCHLKAQRVGSPSLELLREIPGVEIVDLAAGCCGMAGTFGMKTRTYDLSMAMGEPLFRRVAETAPTILASECSTCRMQIAHATGLPVIHPITLLAEAYGL